MTTTRTALIALTATLALGVSACGSDDPSAGGDTTTVTATSTTSASTTSESPTGTSSDDSSSSATSGGAAADDWRAAITAAEKEVGGGTAHAIDDNDDDGTWEVDVAKGATSSEVHVAADGTARVDDRDDDLDDDDRAGLQAVRTSLLEAIDLALDEVGGTLDDAELESDDGRHHWEVSVDLDGGGERDVHVDVRTGEVMVAPSTGTGTGTTSGTSSSTGDEDADDAADDDSSSTS